MIISQNSNAQAPHKPLQRASKKQNITMGEIRPGGEGSIDGLIQLIEFAEKRGKSMSKHGGKGAENGMAAAHDFATKHLPSGCKDHVATVGWAIGGIGGAIKGFFS